MPTPTDPPRNPLTGDVCPRAAEVHLDHGEYSVRLGWKRGGFVDVHSTVALGTGWQRVCCGWNAGRFCGAGRTTSVSRVSRLDAWVLPIPHHFMKEANLTFPDKPIMPTKLATFDDGQSRWQEAINTLCCKLAPAANIDGAGCDSGDPLDISLTEISQVMNHWQNRAHDALGEMGLLAAEGARETSLDTLLRIFVTDEEGVPRKTPTNQSARELDLLEALKLAYRKHHLDDQSVGWDELSDRLHCALCNAMGDDGYQRWMQEQNKPDDHRA